MGYTFLDYIESNYDLNLLNILVIIFNKSDFEKISFIQSSRIFDYVSKSIEVDEIVVKLQETLELKNMPSKKIEQKVQVEVNAEMTHISESGGLFSSNVIFNSNQLIDITGSILQSSFGISIPVYNISKTITSADGSFISELDFLNLTNEARLKIRKLIYGWSLK